MPSPASLPQDLRHTFTTVVNNPENYIFNEEDEGLPFPNVPAVRLTPENGEERFAALFCCVHKRNVGEWDDEEGITCLDVFPLPLRLACRATRRTDGQDRYMLLQEVMVAPKGQRMRIKLIGANLDTSPEAQLLQLKELQREFWAAEHDEQQFAAVLFGDFANRLVADAQFTGFVQTVSGDQNKAAEHTLTSAGAEVLCSALVDPVRRRALWANDSLSFKGVVVGRKM